MNIFLRGVRMLPILLCVIALSLAGLPTARAQSEGQLSAPVLPLIMRGHTYPVLSTPTSTPTATMTAALTETATTEPETTPTVTGTPTPTATITPTLAPHEGMALVPAGGFHMGSLAGDSDEQPPHWVNLDAFWIDVTETTNGAYQSCVDAGVCEPPLYEFLGERAEYYGAEAYIDYPVVYVSWQDADTFCQWLGKRLPTEAEWEKASRGTDERTYPWGSSDPSPDLANYNETGVANTSQTGAYLAGASPYGALDMAGNVWEWVNDWYDADYYVISPSDNPTGPISAIRKTLRGGSFDLDKWTIRSANRFRMPASHESSNIGFRCAR
jgi:eukaryotic-like serine/threonine-protein kinase